jgi:hypothetical protein
LHGTFLWCVMSWQASDTNIQMYIILYLWARFGTPSNTPKFILSHLLEEKKVAALIHKAQRYPHSSWRASDNTRFVILMSLVKKWRAKNFQCNVRFLVWHTNKKLHFISTHQKCW